MRRFKLYPSDSRCRAMAAHRHSDTLEIQAPDGSGQSDCAAGHREPACQALVLPGSAACRATQLEVKGAGSPDLSAAEAGTDMEIQISYNCGVCV